MYQSSPLNLLPAAAGETVSEKRQTPLDVGNSLFRDLIMREGHRATGGRGGISFPACGGPRRGHTQGDPLEGLDEEGRYAGLAFAQMRLPGTVAPQLGLFLEKQGLSRGRIDQLILSATDRDGLIHLDRLMARFQKETAGENASGGYHVIRSRNIPRLEAMLFQLGLGVGEVKEVVEKSINQKGDLRVERLSSALSGLFPETSTVKGMMSLLRHFDVKSEPRDMVKGLHDPDLKSALKDLSEGVPQDAQQKIKQEIAQLLRQKGVPPQEVKSFLETLSVGYARKILRDEDTAALPEKGKTTRDGLDFLNRVVIRARPEWYKEGWHEKILKILKGEGIPVTGAGGKDGLQDETALRLKVAELLKKGETRAAGPFPESSPVLEKGRGQQVRGVRQMPVEIQGREKPVSPNSSKAEDGMGGDFRSLKTGQARLEPGSANQTRSPVHLPEPLPKVLDRMIWMMQAGQEKGRLSISPPELGRLDLDLVIKQGHLQANLSAETLAVKELIEQNLTQLKQQLTDQGFIVDKFEVMVGLDNRRFPDGEARTGGQRRGQSSRRQKREPGLGSVAAGPPRPRGDHLNQIDVHV
jgi:hypothetical protein